MTSRSRIPPLLEDVIQHSPDGFLTLLTGVSNATPHWLIIQYLSRYLSPSQSDKNSRNDDIAYDEESTNASREEVDVVLISWMRSYDYWKTESRRVAGIDLSKLYTQERFHFVDGFTELYSNTRSTPETEKVEVNKSGRSTGTSVSSLRGGPGSAASTRTIPPQSSTINEPTQKSTSTTTTTTSTTTTTTLESSSFNAILATLSPLLTSSNNSPSTRRKVLILDSPTTLLFSSQSPFTLHDFTSFILSLRSLPLVQSTIISLESDLPFLSTTLSEEKDHRTPLEILHSGIVIQLAHQAGMVLSTRGLESGWAKDVSGVLSVRRGGDWVYLDESTDKENMRWKGHELEVLYKVSADGNIKVFGKGGAEIA